MWYSLAHYDSKPFLAQFSCNSLIGIVLVDFGIYNVVFDVGTANLFHKFRILCLVIKPSTVKDPGTINS